MSSPAGLPHDNQYYVHRAHELRRQYIAQLWRQGFAALSRVIRRAVQLIGRRLKSRMRDVGDGHYLRDSAQLTIARRHPNIVRNRSKLDCNCAN